MTSKVKTGKSLVALALIAVATTLYSFTVAVDFSGKWVFNAEKSDLGMQGGGGGGFGGGGGGRGGRFGGDLTITQDSKMITIVRTRNTPNGETTTTEKITLDGKESKNEIAGFGGNTSTQVSTASWSADGKSLTIKSKRELNFQGNEMTIESTDVYSLTDAKTLSVKSTSSGFQGGDPITRTLVYNKQ